MPRQPRFLPMDNDLENLEEDLKGKNQPKKKPKVSGRSVLKLQEIIASRGNLPKQIIKKKSKEGDDDSRKTLAGES